jgi:uncharacterized protein YpmS
MMRNKSFLLVLAVLTLVLAALACNLPGTADSGPAATPIPVTTEAVQAMVTEVIQAATQAAAGGPITLTFTEQQLTSAAALELQNQDQYDVRNIQVRLRDGLVTITGDVNQSGFNLPLKVSMRVTPDANGRVQADVVEANIGPLPLPEAMVSELEQEFNQTLQSELAAAGQNVVVDSISIADGTMVIQAHSQ